MAGSDDSAFYAHKIVKVGTNFYERQEDTLLLDVPIYMCQSNIPSRHTSISSDLEHPIRKICRCKNHMEVEIIPIFLGGKKNNEEKRCDKGILSSIILSMVINLLFFFSHRSKTNHLPLSQSRIYIPSHLVAGYTNSSLLYSFETGYAAISVPFNKSGRHCYNHISAGTLIRRGGEKTAAETPKWASQQHPPPPSQHHRLLSTGTRSVLSS